MTDGASGARALGTVPGGRAGAAEASADVAAGGAGGEPRGIGGPTAEAAATGGPAAAESLPDFHKLAANAAVKQGNENFPVALKFLPARVRAELTAVYRFARLVDDVGDESDTDRGASLDVLDADVGRIGNGAPVIPEVVGIAGLVREYGMPVSLFRDLIDANRMDQRVTRYTTFDDLVGYCVLSANPVGRIVLHLARSATPVNEADSDAVCTGLQVVEHLQDVSEDLGRGRIYLPADDLAAFGVSEADLATPHAGAAVAALVRHECDRAEALLARGRPLVHRLHGWARVAVSGYVAGGLAALAGIRAARYDVLPGPPRASKLRLVREAAAVLLLPARTAQAPGRST